MRQIFISAGEASGDHYGAELVHAMQQHAPLAFFGLCGAAMVEAGCQPVVRAETVAHMGITEVVRHAPHIYAQFRKLKQAIRRQRPDLAVLIDFPDVNFRLARHCHSLGIPVLWLVSPQLWAWKKRRLRWVQRWVTRMLVIFPFEEQFYRERGVDAVFLGHPLADLPMPGTTRQQFARQHGLDQSKRWIALLPGSRKKEFALHFPTLSQAATLLGPNFQFLVPIAATLDWQHYAARVRSASHSPAPQMFPVHDARAAMFHAEASVVASGTATVQAALMGNPFVIIYRMSPLSFRLAKALVSVPFAGMPNLIAGRQIVPELLQAEFTPQNIVQTLQPLLQPGEPRSRMQQDLIALRQSLSLTQDSLPNVAARAENKLAGATAMQRAASAAMAMLQTHSDCDQ